MWVSPDSWEEPWKSSSLASFCTASSTLSSRYTTRPFSPDTNIKITRTQIRLTTHNIYISAFYMHACEQKNKNACCQCKCSLISDTHHDTEILWCIAHYVLLQHHCWKPQIPFFLLQDMKWIKEQWEWYTNIISFQQKLILFILCNQWGNTDHRLIDVCDCQSEYAFSG